MSKLPIVSIVGRQNVGKSTLFNTLLKSKKSIVDSYPGLTRDIISGNITHDSVVFTLSDTPGLDLSSKAELSEQIINNAMEYLKKSSVVLLLLENPAPDSFDLELVSIIRKLSIPTIVAVNKMDNNSDMDNMVNFYETGFNEVIPISAKRRGNINLLLDNIVRYLPVKKSALREPDIRVAIVGRPNAGKSTLLNSFMGFERSVVSDIPGTTRDSVDDSFMYHEKLIEVIDTAGIRRKSRISENIEYYSFTRTIESLKKCDVAIHLIDATVGLTENDKKISDEIIKSRKPIIIAINKWDTLDKDHKTFEEFRDRLIFKFYRAADFPIISISAKNKQRIDKLLKTAVELVDTARKRIDTPTLNKIVIDLQSKGKIPQLGEKIRIYYSVQVDTVPPQFKFFVNNPDFFRKDVVRYFEKAIQDTFGLKGVPIIIHIEGKKGRKDSEKKSGNSRGNSRGQKKTRS